MSFPDRHRRYINERREGCDTCNRCHKRQQLDPSSSNCDELTRDESCDCRETELGYGGYRERSGDCSCNRCRKRYAPEPSSSNCDLFRDLEETSCEEANQCKKVPTEKQIKRFHVSWQNKTGHKWADSNNTNVAIFVNGRGGATLSLKKDYTYLFEVEANPNVDQTFYLSSSPVGNDVNNKVADSFLPVSSKTGGKVYYKIVDSTPKVFFYQSTKAKCAGGVAILTN